MKKQDYLEKLFDLLHTDLSQEAKNEIIKDLEGSGMNMKEIEAILSVDQLVEKIHVPEPSERMDKRFYAMVEDEQRKALLGEPDARPQKKAFSQLVYTGLSIAAGISLFLLGWFASGWFGTHTGSNSQLASLTGEVKQLKETLVLAMMQQSSSVERIKAVNMVSEFDTADKQIIESLIEILNHDSNDNVRLLALDALIRYSSMPEVRDKLISSIGRQTSPMVQLRFTEIMMALNEKRAVPEFEKVLQNVNLNYNVRGKMHEAVDVLL
jgi:hypothetical protein